MKLRIPLFAPAFLIAGVFLTGFFLFPANAFPARLVFLEKFGYPT
jgi:hypothetical protein